MKTFLFTVSLLFSFVSITYAQYTETFDLANKGILAGNVVGSCNGTDATSCSAFDFEGVNWMLDGNLTGVDSEGLFTKSGYLHFEDVDEESCWVSPILDISASPSSSFNVEFTIPSGSTWDNSSTVGSADYADIKYSLDGAPFVALANVNGCPGSGHTLSGIGCGGVAGPATFNIGETGLSGSTLRIRVCVDTNASSDDGWLETVSTTGAVVLPVTWNSVTVSESKKGPVLKWSTSSEENSEMFQVERMNPQTNDFEAIGELMAAGFSTEELTYEFTDSRYISNQINYYRIKQVDFNGLYTYSEVVSLRVVSEETHKVHVYPNPATDILQVEADLELSKRLSAVKIYNIYGAIETVLTVDSPSGQKLRVDVSHLNEGLYFLKLEDVHQGSLGKTVFFQKM